MKYTFHLVDVFSSTPSGGNQLAVSAGGWRVTGIMVQAESTAAPLPKEYLP